MPTLLEKEIQKQILTFLQYRKIFCWKNHSVGIFDQKKNLFRPSAALKGVSDILGILPDGRFLAIEVKRKKGVATPQQRAFIDNINARGGVSFIARSIEDVSKNLERYLCPK